MEQWVRYADASNAILKAIDSLQIAHGKLLPEKKVSDIGQCIKLANSVRDGLLTELRLKLDNAKLCHGMALVDQQTTGRSSALNKRKRQYEFLKNIVDSTKS